MYQVTETTESRYHRILKFSSAWFYFKQLLMSENKSYEVKGTLSWYFLREK